VNRMSNDKPKPEPVKIPLDVVAKPDSKGK
jgi:hypothetical protein